MVLLIFRLIEYFACSNQSNFWPKFHENATSGNAGLIFFIIFTSGIKTDISRAKFFTKLCPVLPEVAFSWNFGQNFDWLLHAKYSINQKIKSTIMLNTKNTIVYQMISLFDFLRAPYCTKERNERSRKSQNENKIWRFDTTWATFSNLISSVQTRHLHNQAPLTDGICTFLRMKKLKYVLLWNKKCTLI